LGLRNASRPASSKHPSIIATKQRVESNGAWKECTYNMSNTEIAIIALLWTACGLVLALLLGKIFRESNRAEDREQISE